MSLDDFIRAHAESAYHPCGTCKMGSTDDPMSVVDPECRVIGVDGLALARNGLFVLDRAEAVVHRVCRDGRVLATLGAGELAQPSAIAADRSDRVAPFRAAPPAGSPRWR